MLHSLLLHEFKRTHGVIQFFRGAQFQRTLGRRLVFLNVLRRANNLTEAGVARLFVRPTRGSGRYIWISGV
jgi:hypothetical protein